MGQFMTQDMAEFMFHAVAYIGKLRQDDDGAQNADEHRRSHAAAAIQQNMPAAAQMLEYRKVVAMGCCAGTPYTS
ncbi:hypothetical protein SDC9_211861 [bioreactor metagenome]|uniref:Uncharacterized protein n=1 Tax=bioreactor metagenome TaxID=1076179 RepID=A0A645JLW4_9ZZZZ